ncbi:MAG: lysylphosphatidylglycerol synthase domain-containing protein, partial [Acidimicrobiales bacterium]
MGDAGRTTRTTSRDGARFAADDPRTPDGNGGNGDNGGTLASPDHRSRWSRWPRWLPAPKVVLVVLIVAAFGFLLFRIRGDLSTAFHRVRPRGLVWLPGAFGAELLSFLAYAFVQRRLLSAGGVRMPRRTVIRLTVAATGISNLVPGGTAPSSGWLVSQYRRHGVPLPLALWAVLAGGFVAAISVLFLLLVGAGIAGVLGPGPFVVLLAVLVGVAVGGVAVSHHLRGVRTWLDRDRRIPLLRLARRAVRHAGDVGHFRATVPGGVHVYALSIANWVLDVVVLAVGFSVLAGGFVAAVAVLFLVLVGAGSAGDGGPGRFVVLMAVLVGVSGGGVAG